MIILKIIVAIMIFGVPTAIYFLILRLLFSEDNGECKDKPNSLIGLTVTVCKPTFESKTLREEFNDIELPVDLEDLNIDDSINFINKDSRFRIPFQNFVKRVKSQEIYKCPGVKCFYSLFVSRVVYRRIWIITSWHSIDKGFRLPMYPILISDDGVLSKRSDYDYELEEFNNKIKEN